MYFVKDDNSQKIMSFLSTFDHLYKVIVIGDSEVGKSNLISRFAYNRFNSESKPTIGVEFAHQVIDCDGVKIAAHLWDTAGQERFRALSGSYYRGSHGALIVYDITKRSTFHSVERWLREVKTQADSGCLILLVGNKSDLEHRREVTTIEVTKYAEEHGVHFMETSALTNSNVERAFSSLLTQIAYKYQGNLSQVSEHNQYFSSSVPEPTTVRSDVIKLEQPEEEADLRQVVEKGGCSC